MTQKELEKFLENHSHIDYAYDGNLHLFRNTNLPWYQNDEGRCTAVMDSVMPGLTEERLLAAINKGLEIENITRVTGYMSKVGSWNPGKLGELKDRHKESV